MSTPRRRKVKSAGPSFTHFATHLRDLADALERGDLVGAALTFIPANREAVAITSTFDPGNARRMELAGAASHAVHMLHQTEHNLRSVARAHQPDPMTGAPA
jgi:hypothetical protein